MEDLNTNFYKKERFENGKEELTINGLKIV